MMRCITKFIAFDVPLLLFCFVRRFFFGLLSLITVGFGLGCVSERAPVRLPSPPQSAEERTLRDLRSSLCPDPHLHIFNIAVSRTHAFTTLEGDVDSPTTKAAVIKAFSSAKPPVKDLIRVLPASDLGEKTAGIINLSVANGREAPDHKAEMGTQWFMGETVKIWKALPFWLLTQGADGYLAWVERGSVVSCTSKDAENWEQQKLTIVTGYEAILRAKADPLSDPVSDLVMGDRARVIDRSEEWIQLELPDGRRGFLEKSAAADWLEWKATRKPSSTNIERTARLFLGRPYLWGGCSPKGMDCSGFTRQVFSLNGILLPRNAAQQANCGISVDVRTNFDQLRKGDLLFFGKQRGRRSKPEVTHVAIYLGDQMFIQSSQRVRVSSLDPRNPLFDERHARQLLSARRVLPEGNDKN